MRTRSLFALLFACSFLPHATAQRWVDLMNDGANVHDVQAAFNAYWQGRPYQRSKGFKVFKRWEWMMEQRTWPSGVRPAPETYMEACRQMRSMEHVAGMKSAASWEPMGPYTWQSTSYNPGNGRVNCTAVDPNNSSILYAGTPSGGLWRSSDDGQTWNALFTDEPTLGVSGIVIDPVNSDVIYCATGDGDGTDTYGMGVIKSTDGGGTWNTTGLNWNTSLARVTRTLRMSPADHLTLFCATSNGLWKTSDGGLLWAKVADGSFHDVEFKPGDANTVYACGDRFFLSTNGGSSFTVVTSGLPTANTVNRMRIAVSAADAAKVYVLCGSEADAGFLGLYRSNDSGASFTLRSSSPNIFGYDDSGGDSGGQSSYDMALAVDQTNANRVWAGGINVWTSTNGGTSWSILSHWVWDGFTPYTHADIHCLDVAGTRLYCGSDGGIFRSLDLGNTWNDLSTGLQIGQFYRLGGTEADPGLIIAGAQDNGMNLLSGGVWTHVMGADGMEGAIDPSDPQIIYGESQNGGIQRSDDGGTNWGSAANGINETGAWVTPYVVDPQQPNIVLAGFNNLWRSTNHGLSWTNWTNVTTTRTMRAVAIAPSSSNVVWWCNDNTIRRTMDGGANWVNVTGTLPDNAITSIAIHPTDPQEVYVSLSGYTASQKVYRTTDAGATWVNISGNLPNVPVNSVVYQAGSDGGIYVGTDIGVFYTDNTLSNWQPFSQGLPKVIVNELEINYAAGKLRAATYGRGIWQSGLFTPDNAPPTAEFTTSSPDLCAGDVITFADASLGASPGWTWSFPGGTPSSSSVASPTVSYATTGNYTATLTVSNAFGTDSYSADIPVTILPNRIDIAITFDSYPGETSWNITNDANGTVVANGGPYTGLNPNGSVQEHRCLDQGCYTITFNDSYGDGMCCDNGTGQFTVTNTDLGTIASGGTFAYSTAASFCVSIGLSAAAAPPITMIDLRPLDDAGSYSLSVPGLTGPFTLEIFDAMGRSLGSRKENAALGSTAVDLRPFAAGIYMVRVQAGDRSWVARAERP